MKIVKVAKLTKFKVEILCQTASKVGLERGLYNYLASSTKYVFMIFTVKVDWCKGRKIMKTYQNFARFWESWVEPPFKFKNAISNILGNSRKIFFIKFMKLLYQKTPLWVHNVLFYCSPYTPIKSYCWRILHKGSICLM